MSVRANVLVAAIILAGLVLLGIAARQPGRDWLFFTVYLAAALVSSALKVKRPSGSGSMSFNYPFIFLAVLRLSPLQAGLIAALSVAAQCRVKKVTPFSMLQCTFNVSNSVVSTAWAYGGYTMLTHWGLPSAPALAFAACLYFFCNTLSVAVVIGWSQGQPVLQLWKDEFRWFFPFYMVGAVLAEVAHALSLRFGWTTGILVAPVVYTLYRAYNAQVEQWEERRAHLEETEALHLRTIEGLAMAIEAKDHNTHEHLFRVRDYVTDIGNAMGLDRSQIKALQIAAFLHDIGKLAVPEHIINKPGKLSVDEFEKMKIHPGVGADILERVRFPYPVVPIVRSHHERWDGAGYPDGLKGEDIPLGARILSVVDCFDALASDRPYRRAMPLEKAMEIVKASAGTQFDPVIVAVLEQRYKDMEVSLQERATFGALDVEVKVQRGDAPGAGFEHADATVEQLELAKGPSPAGASTSLGLIAAASHEARVLFEMSQAAGGPMSLSETAWIMESRLRALIPFDCCAVYLKGVEAVTCCYLTDAFAQVFRPQEIALGEGISGWVAQSGRAILNGNATVETSYDAAKDIMGLQSALAVPLFDLQQQIIGVLTLYCAQADGFTRDHARILQAAEANFSLAMQNALASERSNSDSSTDALTGLLNARGMFRTLDGELNRSRRSGSALALIVFDLDNFHHVNEAEGHAAGNTLLRSIAEHLSSRCRSYDTPARVGGDEFALLLPAISEPLPFTDDTWVEGVLAAAMDETALHSEISASTGMAIFPRDGATAEELLATASRRMHLNKRKHHASKPVSVPPVKHEETAAVAA